MKIEAHVLEVRDLGEKLVVVGQGQPVNSYDDPALRPWMHLQIQMPINTRNRKAFYVGRHFDITVTPR